MTDDTTEVPKELRYSKEHEWVRLDGDVALVGVTDYAQQELHEVVYVELPKPGKSVKQMGSLCVIETMKAVADVFAPVSGEVIEVNETLNAKPELVNSSPYKEGWLVKIKATGDVKEELGKLMDAASYRQFIEGGEK